MFLDMLGLGPLVKMLSDPASLQQAQNIVNIILDTHARCVRVEAKLDLLLSGEGDGHDNFTAMAALIPGGVGADGTRGPAVTGGASHDGNGGSGAAPQNVGDGIGRPGGVIGR
jgi:hypothetical protein